MSISSMRIPSSPPRRRSAQAVRSHPHREQCRRPIDDRMAHRLCRRARAAHHGDGHDLIAVDVKSDCGLAVGGGGSAGRPQDFIAEHNLIFKERRDLCVSMLNQACGIHCPKRGKGALWDPSDIPPGRRRIWGEFRAKAEGSSLPGVVTSFCKFRRPDLRCSLFVRSSVPRFAFDATTRDRRCGRRCRRIQRFCGNLK